MSYDLQTIYQECADECLRADIPIGRVSEVTVNRRARKRWGQCILDPKKKTYSISISWRLLDESIPVTALKETILHELCHTVPGGMKHTGNWKKCADTLNRKYGYNIKRVNSFEDKGLEDPEAGAAPSRTKKINYSFVCKGCGQVVNRERMSPFVKHYRRYRCAKCGSAFRRIL